MRKIFYLILIIVLFFPYRGFSKPDSNKHFVIGFSQCASDIWRQSMDRAMKIELEFYPNLTLLMKNAEGNSQQQIKDIRGLLKKHINLLIVSPNESKPLTPIVEKAYKSGIPVILIDRKIASNHYTAFVGANNFYIGELAGKYAAKLLNGKGKIVIIQGLEGSSPAVERNDGFLAGIKPFPNIKVVFSAPGDWQWTGGKKDMTEVLKKKIPFNLVFAHNDFMALGAYAAAKKFGKEKSFYLLGIDGLPGKNGGIEAVIHHKLNATFLYPTGGDVAIKLAWKILTHQPYMKDTQLQTTVIDSANAWVTKLQTDHITDLQEKIEKQYSILKHQVAQNKRQQIILTLILSLFALAIILGITIYRAYRAKNIANQQLAKQKREIEVQNEKLVEIGVQLERATEAKLIFFTNISHEFRTPLTLILGTLDNMINSRSYSEDQLKQLMMIHKNGVRLLRLINQLMDFRKVESGKMSLKAGNYDLISFIQNIKESFQGLADKKKIDFQCISKEKKLNLYFDWEKMDEIIFNLLSNAFKFTPEGGSIIITIEQARQFMKGEEKDVAVINIKDTGAGISKEAFQNIFERFGKTEKHPSNSFPSTGIGMALTKGLVELHSGKIQVESEKGKGTKVDVIIPMGKEHLFKEELLEDDKTINTEKERPVTRKITEDIDFVPVFDSEESSDYNSEYIYGEKPTVLIVEDNLDMQDFIKSNLGTGYHIIVAENGEAGLSKLEEETPDLIISDVMMPVMDGLTMLKKIKNDIKFNHIPVIILSAKASMEYKLEGLETGADSYIPKPFNKRHLQIRVNKLIESRKQIRKYYQEHLSFNNDQNAPNKGSEKRFIDKIVNTINDNRKNNQFGVEQLSQELGISRVHLYRKVKQLTGLPISELIRSVKLNSSRRLLTDSDLSNAQIAYEVGFSSPSYFAKCFKEMFKVSPSEYREKMKK